MENRSFIQLSLSTDESFEARYMIVIEIVEQKIKKVHIVAIPSWLVYYSEKYRYYSINLN
jgi:hypothetical protein